MSDGFLDIDPDAVVSAGTRTAGTAGQWSGWATQIETLLRSAASDAQESEVTSAIEGYLSTWSPRLHGLATNADALGTNAVTASNVVSGADSTSATSLNAHGGTESANGTQLARPITAY